MQTHEILAVPALHGIEILDRDDPRLRDMLGQHRVHQVAEANDTRRLHHLLHRGEYRPIVAVMECDNPHCKTVRVYFSRIEEPPTDLTVKPR